MAESYICSFTMGITAGEELPANRFINFTDKLCSSAENSKGVTSKAIANGTKGRITVLGFAEVLSGDVFYVGDSVCGGDNGIAVAQSSGKPVLGYALVDANSSDIMPILLK